MEIGKLMIVVFFSGSFDLSTHDWSTYTENVVRGVREYLLKMSPSTLPAARRHMRNLRRARNLAGLAAAAAPAMLLVLSFHLRRSERAAAAAAALATLARQLHRLAALPAAAARDLLLALARRLAAFRPLAVTMTS